MQRGSILGRGWAILIVEEGMERFVEDDLRKSLSVIAYVPNEDGMGRAAALSRGWVLVWIDAGMPWNAIERAPFVTGVRETPDGDIEVVSLDTMAAIRGLERAVWAAVRAERQGEVPAIDVDGARALFADIGELLAVARRAVAARANRKAPSGGLPSGL